MTLPHLNSRWLGPEIDYHEALRLQNELAAQRLRGVLDHNILLLLEHQPVYTIGRTRDQSSLASPIPLPHPVVETNRGGQATYHGPGQLVGYPIIALADYQKDLHLYLRALESTLIAACKKHGLQQVERRDDLTGIWIGKRKLASIGVGVRHWITQHGFALNITPESLPPFLSITPCGISGVTMTCLHQELIKQSTSEKSLPQTQEVAETISAILPQELATLTEQP